MTGDEHVLEIAGARLRVSGGVTEAVSDPKVRRCPLRQRLYGIGEESRETVLASLSMNMEDVGMFTSGRELSMQERTVTFGASEIIADALAAGLLDCAVTVCEGAGTVIVTRPEVMQAIGAHMTGLVSTSPIEATVRALEGRGCVVADPEAGIDQVAGCLGALEAGHRKVAVTMAGQDALAASAIREMAGEMTIFACHNTGIGHREAEVLRDQADIVYSCASREVREVVAPAAKVQIGRAIPVFGMTDRGKRLILNRAMNMDVQLLVVREGLPSLDPAKGPEPLS